MSELEAQAKLDELMRVDPATIAVINAMRARGQTWSKIVGCFGKLLRENNIDPYLRVSE